MRRKAKSRSPFAVDWPRYSATGASIPQPQPPAYATALPPPTTATMHEERIRRNVACVSCRNSKVRCKTSTVPGQPCQRCAKMAISCVVDKSHKRVTKRSKLEQLEQELISIKQAVIPMASNNSTTWSPPSPRTTLKQQPEPISLVPSSRSSDPQIPTPISEVPRTNSLTRPSLDRTTRSVPAEPRMLGSLMVSGEDIDFYFDRYLQYYHPYLPIVRRTDPNDCFNANQTLFWTIIYISCRRFCRNETLWTTILEDLSNHPWTTLSTTRPTPESLHALLLICNWPLPVIRLLSDPTPSLANVAMTACQQLGFHRGQGASQEFGCCVREEATCTDEEASAVWIACCIMANQAGVLAGIVPPSIQYNSRSCKANLENPEWAELISLYELQKWMNRFHSAMAAEMAAHDVVSEAAVSQWEYEFDIIKPTLISLDTDTTRLAVLAARLDIQSYYLLTPPTPLPPSLSIHATSLFNTARTYLTTSTSLSSSLLHHHPQWSFRALLTSSAIIISSLQQHNTACSTISPTEADDLARLAFSSVSQCSIREGDMAARVGFFMETFWSLRHHLPRGDVPVGSWPERLGAGVAFGTLRNIKVALIDAKKIKDDENDATHKIRPNPMTTNGTTTPPGDLPVVGSSDPFLGTDWSIFMDDFGWGREDSMFMGLP